MTPVLELRLELLSTNRWRVTDPVSGDELIAEKVTDIGSAVSHLLERRAQGSVTRVTQEQEARP